MVRNIFLDLLLSHEIDSHLTMPGYHRLIELKFGVRLLKVLFEALEAALLVKVFATISTSSRMHRIMPVENPLKQILKRPIYPLVHQPAGNCHGHKGIVQCAGFAVL